MRNTAKQTLVACRQRSAEYINEFREQLTKLLRGATIGMSQQTVQERLLDEFVDRLSPPEWSFMVQASFSTASNLLRIICQGADHANPLVARKNSEQNEAMREVSWLRNEVARLSASIFRVSAVT